MEIKPEQASECEGYAHISKKVGQLGRCLQGLEQTISLEGEIELHTAKARIYTHMKDLLHKLKAKGNPLTPKSALEAYKAIPQIPPESGDKHLEEAQALVKDFLLSFTKRRYEVEDTEVNRGPRRGRGNY